MEQLKKSKLEQASLDQAQTRHDKRLEELRQKEEDLRNEEEQLSQRSDSIEEREQSLDSKEAELTALTEQYRTEIENMTRDSKELKRQQKRLKDEKDSVQKSKEEFEESKRSFEDKMSKVKRLAWQETELANRRKRELLETSRNIGDVQAEMDALQRGLNKTQEDLERKKEKVPTAWPLV
eukprot:TRINITY_DN4275_c0_g2_i1.p1 TRINITY_DN4275_c0_g2~~TRINITY_DN4275_c0_g2_i1.p1  ORF type:complete len:195 (-),score=80.94 TRINITY_DN4275_c0_g2_i1:27-566(-)